VFVVTEVAVTPASNVVAPLTDRVLDKVDAPVTAKVVLKLPDVPVNAPPMSVAPVISTASAMVTFVESLESKVVPLILNALIRTSPVPLGCMLMSAFEPLLVIEFVVIAPGDIVPVKVPLNVPPFIVGLVNVLLVKVCVAVNPTTCSPPAVEPSCNLKVFVVVSTVISPAEPVNELFCVVFPLLNCSVVGIIIVKISSRNTKSVCN